MKIHRYAIPVLVLYVLVFLYIEYRFSLIDFQTLKIEITHKRVRSPGEIDPKPVYRYVPIHNTSIIGKAIPMDDETWPYVRYYLKEVVFKRKPITLDGELPKRKFFDVVAPVTGSSTNHYKELVQSVDFFAWHFKGQFSKLIFYDLGLNESQANEFKKRPYVIYRKFNFDKYPPHVRNLKVYSWKPIVLGEVLSEHDGVMWFDTSVKVDGDFTNVLARQVRLKSSALFFLKGRPVHSAAAATHPSMYDYIPLTSKGKAGLTHRQLPAGTILLLNTADMQEHVMKWLAICSLVKECIAPPGAQLRCPSNIYNIPRHEYAGEGCHRYEQALQTLLVTNLYNSERHRYRVDYKEALADRVYS